jgi:hypothetical protein
MTTLCRQCGGPAESCERCGGALCPRRLCAELHEAACAAVATLPSPPSNASSSSTASAIARVLYDRPKPKRTRDPEAERVLAEQLMARVAQHRHAGRAALLIGDLDTAFDELWSARLLEPELDHLGASARQFMPADWELETDLLPLARALSARHHPRTAETWRRLLEDRPARSVQAEAADWLAQDSSARKEPRLALRLMHAASALGHARDATAFQVAYRQAGIDPKAAFTTYLAACRTDQRTARAAVLRDPLTDAVWADQDPRWWLQGAPPIVANDSEHHQLEALHRAGDLALTSRDQGWVMLAEGDYTAGPLGVRTLGRGVRAGCAEPADEDTFVRIRLAYEGAAERLPESAWPWFRLAELLAWAGFAERADEYLAQAERLSLGSRDAERTARPLLRALVHAGLGYGPDGLVTAARPFPSEPFGTPFRLRLPFGR